MAWLPLVLGAAGVEPFKSTFGFGSGGGGDPDPWWKVLLIVLGLTAVLVGAAIGIGFLCWWLFG